MRKGEDESPPLSRVYLKNSIRHNLGDFSFFKYA